MKTRLIRIVKSALMPAIALALAGGCSGDGGSEDTGAGTDINTADAMDATVAGDTSDPGMSADVDWDSLPRLPEGKTFKTRYAAAAAERIITPDHPIFMGGFGFCGGSEETCRESEGIHDDLKVGVVAVADTQTGEVVMFAGIDSSGMIAYDHNLIHEMVQQRLYEDYGVYFQGERLTATASHSHAAPDMTGLWGPMFGYGRDDEYAAMVREQTVDAAAEAFGNLGDVNMVWAKGSSPNHTDGSDPKPDMDLWVLQGKRPDDSPVFTMIRWSSHPTAYGSSNNGISSDWWGPLRDILAAKYGGVIVPLTGCIGGTYPDRPVECGLAEEQYPNGWKDPDLSEQDFMKVTCTGKLVADNTVEALKNTTPVAETGIGFAYSEFKFHPDNGVLMLAAKTAPIPYEFVDVNDPNSQMFSELSWSRVGDLNFVTTPGESFPEFGDEAEKVLTDAGYTNPIVLGLAHDWLGYILVDYQWADPELSYNQGLSVGEGIEKAFMDKLDEILP